MTKFHLLVPILAILPIKLKGVDLPPETSISNGVINARLLLPDAKNGYYRGSRFDWSGVMPELECNGHSYFGQWDVAYAPTLHDAIMGPVETFSPVGYDEANAGGSFLMIGVGMVTKTDQQKYGFWNYYPVANPGLWSVEKKAGQVEFIQELADENYAYRYQKTVQLVHGKSVMLLLHSLKNSGKRPIDTTAYNHNFLVIDKQPVGRSFVVSFPYSITGEAKSPRLGEVRGNKVVFLKDLERNDHLQCLSLEGFGNSAKDYDISIENLTTGAGVRITSDQPLSKLAFWSAYSTICPEPYIDIKVAPGETFRWKICYEFYTIKRDGNGKGKPVENTDEVERDGKRIGTTMPTDDFKAPR